MSKMKGVANVLGVEIGEEFQFADERINKQLGYV